MLAVVWEGASLVRECENGWVGGDEAEAIPLRIARNQVAGAKAFNPKGLWRQHPTRVCWLAWRGFGGQDHGTRPRVRRRGQHRQGAADVEPADQHVNSFPPERERQGRRAGKLIGLDAGQADDHPRAGAAAAPCDRTHGNVLDGVVEKFNVPLQARPERSLAAHFFRQGRQAGQRVAGQKAFPITDDVAVVILLGWLDQHDVNPVQRGCMPRNLYEF